MAMNSHYSGRLQRAVDKVLSESPKKFYEIFTTYDFYDVADETNSLTPEQRNQVPVQNQTRFSQFSGAIAEMFDHVLGGEEGLLSYYVQEIIDKLDVASAMSLSQLSAIGNGLSAIPGGAAINGSMQAVKSQTASAMGTNPFNPDLIPPITIGMPGLPAGIANLYMPGFFQPDWSFMYDQETVKNSKFYIGSNGLMIGAGIPVSGMPELYLKKVFGVTGTNKSLVPTGDLVGGLSPDEFKTIVDASKSSDHTSFVNGSFSLNEMQMRNSFNRYIQASLWEIIVNPTNWANAHWGALTNNACPEPVKTAVCSYIWTQGMAIEPNKTDDLALVSYLVTMGVYYQTGYQYKVRLTPFGIDKDATGTAIRSPMSGEVYYETVGLATDKGIANSYFTLAADVILRTVNMAADEKLGVALRKRRVAEANLIYKYVGMSEIVYGAPVGEHAMEHQVGALKQRKFDAFGKTFTFYRYKNTGVAGGEGEAGELAEPTNIYATLNFSANANKEPMGQGLQNYIRSLMDRAGVKAATVTSTTRTAVDQCRAMYNNLINGTEIKYGGGGRAVTQTFYQNKTKPSSECQAQMVATCKQQPEQKVSRHCSDFNVKVVFDIGPNSITPQSARGAFEAVLRAEAASGEVVTKVLTPADNDPAFHIEVNPNTSFTAHPNREMPDVSFTITNPTLTKETAWNSPLSVDYIKKSSESNSIL